VEDAERVITVLEEHDVVSRVQVALLLLGDGEGDGDRHGSPFASRMRSRVVW